MKKIGLYIHVPFCNGKCPYCDFYSVAANEAEMDKYLDTVIKRLNNYKNENIIIDTIYLGGGTPSLLGTKRLGIMLDSIYNKLNVAKNAEVTFEVNPSSSDSLDFSLLRSKGLNRLSIGMQSAVESEMKFLGRKHTRNDVVNTVTKAQKAGIKNISLDLMIGVPHQEKATLKESMDFCKSLGVQHISAYILKFEENTPFYKKMNTLPLLSDDEQAEQYLFVCEYLEKIGYNQYEISNFSKSGYESKHNCKYWRCEEYIGIGPSAHSFFNGERFYYNRSFQDFYNNITIKDGIGGNKEEFIMLNLRLKRGLIFKEYEERYKENLPERFFTKAKLFDKSGFLLLDKNKVTLTKKGYLVSNSIISELI